jgi:hypothetical protein
MRRTFPILILFFLVLMPGAARAGMPEHAVADVFGSGWACDLGYMKQGDRCVRLALPANAQVNLLADGWECKKGYVKVGDACRSLTVPANAERDPFGNGWRCRRGYFQDGSECFIIKIPLHGQLNASGNDWQCERGFKKKLNICIDMEPAEKSKEDQYYQELYKQTMQEHGPETAPCRSGYNKCTSSCAALEKKPSPGLWRKNDLAGQCLQACVQGQVFCAQEKEKNGCSQFLEACRGSCPQDEDLCLGACQDGKDRCVYQSRQVLSK